MSKILMKRNSLNKKRRLGHLTTEQNKNSQINKKIFSPSSIIICYRYKTLQNFILPLCFLQYLTERDSLGSDSLRRDNLLNSFRLISIQLLTTITYWNDPGG